ncbi:MAG: SdrD B-like domain-containing protein [Fimbriiglobus sp.]
MGRRSASQPQVQHLEDRTVPAMLSGIVYSDINGNAAQDVGEPGLGGVIVHLDEGTDGGALRTVQTKEDGTYSFDNVGEGSNTVSVMPALGTTVVGTTTAVITIRAEDSKISVPAIGLRTNGRASGFIFTDLDGNGVQTSNEPGYVGAMVTLDLNNDGTTELTGGSGERGEFRFGNLPDGVHKLSLNLPINHKATTASSTLITITNGSVATPFNFGIRPSSALSGRLTLSSGVTPYGVPGATVGLDTNGDGVAEQTTTTDASGLYVFSNVPPGLQTILFDATMNARYATPDGSNKLPVTVSAPTPGAQATVQVPDVAVAFQGSVRGSLFLDANSNGAKDDDERFVAPGSVQVDFNNSGKLVNLNFTSLADGGYRIEGLPNGTHTIIINPASGYSSESALRVPVTITAGSTAAIATIGLRGGGIGSTLTLGDGRGPDTRTYSFIRNADGSLSPTLGRTLTTPSTTQAGTRVVTADFNGDGTTDTITATGGGETARIRVYDGKTGNELISGGIQAFEAGFVGGVNLAAGDFNGDGKADIVAAADVGGGPRVRIFNAAQFQTGADPAQGKLFADFLAIEDTKFRGGARVAVGDLDQDGKADLAVAAGQGGGPRIALYDGASIMSGRGGMPEKLIGDFFAYEKGLRNGAIVSIGDVNGDGTPDLVTGAGPGGSPRVTVFSGSGIMANQGANSTRIADFFVNGNLDSRSGTTLTVKDVDNDNRADIVATSGSKAFVYTSTNISNNFLNPRPNGPDFAAVIDGFSVDGSLNVG